MTRLFDFENELLSYLENFKQQIQSRPLNLGGISGSDGGSGGPGGGFVGQLPQSRVTFDTTEAESMSIPSSGQSLLHNLNRIRYRIGSIEDVLASGFALTVQENNTTVATGVLIIDFVNGIINSIGNNEVEVYIPRSGTPAYAFYDLDDVPHFYTGNEGKILVVNSNEDGLEYIDRSFINLIDTPNTYTNSANKFVKVNSTSNGLTFQAATLLDLFDTPNSYTEGLFLKSTSSGFILSPASTAFTNLSDTFESFVDRGGQFLIVNPTEDGITTLSGNFIMSFLGLSDTPDSYGGHSKKAVVVNYDETGLEFVTISGLDQQGVNIKYNATPFLDHVTTINIEGASVIYENDQEITVRISGGSNTIAVKNNGNPFLSSVGVLNFQGFDLTQTSYDEVTISGISNNLTFTNLTDTPANYTGGSAKFVRVKSDESGLEFSDVPLSSGYSNFIDLLDTPSSYAGKSGKVLVVSNTEDGIEFSNITSSGGLTIWYPDAPPDNPHIKSDEFNDGILDNKWTLFDPNGAITYYEEGDYGLRIVQSGVGISSNRMIENVGFLQTVPSGSFSAWTKINTTAFRPNEGKAGIILMSSPIQSSPLIFIGVSNTVVNNLYMQTEYYTDFRTLDLSYTQQVPLSSNFIYLRFRYYKPDFGYPQAFFDFSLDGFTWFVVDTVDIDYISYPFYAGIGVKRQSNHVMYNGNFENYFRFFRFYSDYNFNVIPSGNFVSLGSTGIGGSSTFLELSDTPNSYSGNEFKFVRVNNTGNGLEFATVSGSAKDYFTELFDTPSSYIGHGGKSVKVKNDETGLEFSSQILSFLDLSDTPSNYVGQHGLVLVVNNSENGLKFDYLPRYFTDLFDTPYSYIGEAAKFVRVKSDESGLEFATINSSSSTFIDLADTPSNYTNSSLKLLRVKSDESGIEFITPPSGSNTTFIELYDTPTTYSGQAGKVPVVNSTETGLIFTTISGSGGSIDIYLPLASPASSNSFDDEFNDNSLSSSWTEFDPDSILTISETTYGLEMSQDDNGEKVIGIYKSVPSSSEFTIWTKPQILTPHDKGFKAGIFLCEHSTITTTSDMWVFNLGKGINSYIQIERMNSYNDFYGNYLNSEIPAFFNGLYFRLRIQKQTSTAYAWLDVSSDGISWNNMSAKLEGGSEDYYTVHFVPQSMGLFIKRTFWDSGLEAKAVFPFFRVYNNIDFTYIPRGKRV